MLRESDGRAKNPPFFRMKTSLIGYHNQNFIFSADIHVNSPSGFALHLSKTGDSIYDIVSFSGYSGYIFDQRGDFVGGYRKNQLVNISGNYFYGSFPTTGNLIQDDNAPSRLSYFLNDKLVSNCVSGQTGYFDIVRFEDYGANTLNFEYILDTGSPDFIVASGYVPLVSSEGWYFVGGNG